ncbi:MAG: FeoA family protein [Candidatus Omnitrophota bacterium]
MKKINLIKMKKGQKGIIAHIDGGSGLEKRLAVMGISMEKTITKLSAFVMQGPVAIKSGRTVIALGHGMASRIWINLIEQ